MGDIGRHRETWVVGIASLCGSKAPCSSELGAGDLVSHVLIQENLVVQVMLEEGVHDLWERAPRRSRGVDVGRFGARVRCQLQL